MPTRASVLPVACVIALSGVVLGVAAQPVKAFERGALLVPGPGGVLWLDAEAPPFERSWRPRHPARPAPRARSARYDEVSPRYLEALSRKTVRHPRKHDVRRIADAAPPLPTEPQPSEITRSIDDGETGKLRAQVARLTAETSSLRSELAALREDIAKRPAVSPEPPAIPKAADKSTDAARGAELAEVKSNAERLKDETSRLRGEGEALRGQVATLNAETAGLRNSIAALQTELAKRAVPPAGANDAKAEDAKTSEARSVELSSLKDESARLKDETAKLRGEGDNLRGQLARLSADTANLRSEIAGLKDQLAKQAALPPPVSAKTDDVLPKPEPLRRGDSLKKSGPEGKIVERAPSSAGDERDAAVVERVWRRLLEMVGKPKQVP